MVKGIPAMRARFKAIPRGLQRTVKVTMGKYARQIVAQMKSLAPEDQGDLRDSIGWTFGDPPEGSIAVGSFGESGVSVTIYAGSRSTIVTNSRGVEFQNAKIQEFGREGMPANPYFFVAWRANRSRVRSGIARAVRKYLKKA